MSFERPFHRWLWRIDADSWSTHIHAKRCGFFFAVVTVGLGFKQGFRRAVAVE